MRATIVITYVLLTLTSARAEEEKSPEELLRSAQADLIRVIDAEDEEQRSAARSSARRAIQTARPLVEARVAIDRANWKQFPTFIDPLEEERRARRNAAELALMSSRLTSAQLLFWEAQTYSAEADEHADLLLQAATAFEELHSAYRSQVGGLYARLMQGKCFEERGDVRIALGIYEELLGHAGAAPALVVLKDRALHFRCSCLNRAERADYKLVDQEATQWLASGDRLESTTGQGIQWELCRALESLGNDRTLTAEERHAYRLRGLELAEQLNHAGSEYKSRTLKLMDRLHEQLNAEL